MASQKADFTPVRFSTDDLPELDRIRVWREFFGRQLFRTEIEPVPDVAFHAEMTVRSLPDLDLVSSVMSPIRLSRTRALVRDGNDDVALFLSSSSGTTAQCGREVDFDPGSAVVTTTAETSTAMVRSTARFRCFHIRHAALAPLVANLDDMICRQIAPRNKSLQYLMGYVRFLEEQQNLDEPELARVAALHLRDLIALTFGATGDAAVVAKRRGLRAARLAAIKADIREHLNQPDFTVSDAAAHQGVTPRYVQLLFEREGTTFSRVLLNQRLSRARQMLADPRYAAWTVSAIALEAGFSDVSYFNRRFRQRFGGSPTAFRGA